MKDIIRQLRADRTHVPALVDEYVVHTPRSEAIKAARQVCGVSHYLSLMATGDVDMFKCAMYGVGIVCIDEVTDEMGESLYPGPINAAFRGDAPYESLEIIPTMASSAEDDRFSRAVRRICWAQDNSLKQFADIDTQFVEHITRAKGGWSARANLAMVKGDLTPDEWDYMYRFGHLMQLLDDYLDMPKDRSNGLSTLFTEGAWDGGMLGEYIPHVAGRAERLWGPSAAHSRFFRICRLHRRLGQVENKTPLRAAWLAPGYL